MDERELRGHVLQKFADAVIRPEGMLIVNSVKEITSVADENSIANACAELKARGLIDWNERRGADGGRGGLGRILRSGLDVIDGKTAAPTSVVFIDNSRNMHNSPFSVMGDGNVQNTNVHKIIAAIENSKASETEKKEARSLFDQIFRNKLLWSAIATLLPAGPAN